MVEIKCATPLLGFTEENVAEILAQYNRNVRNISVDIDIIKRWLSTQPHLPLMPTDRQIATFLVMNKFSIERTKEKLDLSFTIKTLLPEFYRGMYPKSARIQKVHEKAGMFIPLAKLTKNYNRVMIFKIDCKEGADFDVVAIESLTFLVLELRTLLDISSSDEYIVDLGGVPFSVLCKFGPMDLKKPATIVEKVYSNRISALHIVNAPSYAEPFISFLKAALQPKIRERVKLHKNYESLSACYPAEILPTDFGGTEKSIAELRVEWKEFLEQHDEYFRASQEAVVDESLRPEKLKNDDILGFHGNFRRLEVD